MSAATPAADPPRRRASLRTRLLAILLLGLLAYVLMITGCQRAVLFPTRVLPDVSDDKPPAGVEVLTRTLERGGEVEAWLVPAPGADDGPRPLVIFAHGNGELIDLWPPLLRPYRERGVSVLLVEFRGYGRSAGKPSEAAIVDDFVYFHDLAARRGDVDPARIVFHGRSVGGGVVAQLAARRRPAAMVLESTCTSIADVARGYFVPWFLVRDPLEVRGVLKTADYPVLLMHGRDDRIIPVTHAEQNHAVCPGSELVVFDGAGHNDPFPHGEYWAAIDALLKKAGTMPATPSREDGP